MNQTPYLQKHVLICTGNDSCELEGGEEVREAVKKELKKRGLRKQFRDSACTCMGLCLPGVNAVIWPDGIYLAGLTVEDAPRLVDFLSGSGPRLEDLEQNAEEKIQTKLSGG